MSATQNDFTEFALLLLSLAVGESQEHLPILTLHSSSKMQKSITLKVVLQVCIFIRSALQVQSCSQRLLGLRVAQIRTIFDLPQQFGTFPHPLIYVRSVVPSTQFI
jgi:hypothetical protein